MNKLTTKNKLKAVIVIAFVLVMAAYFVLVMAVMSADAANNTGARLLAVTPATAGRGQEQEPTTAPTEKEQRARQDAQPEQDLEGCTAGEHWIKIADYLDPETILESWGEGWVLFQNKCGEFYLIPITEPYPYPDPYPYPEPGGEQ